MKSRSRWIAFLAASAFVSVVVWGPISLRDVVFMRQRFQARRIKVQADPVALQRWAVNLLVAHSREEGSYYDLNSTNVPADILALYPGAPSVAAGRDSVVIHWGRSHPSIHVGNTNFSMRKPLAMQWRPGVYLVLAE